MGTSSTAWFSALILTAALCLTGCGGEPSPDTPETAAEVTSEPKVRRIGDNELTGGVDAVVTSGSALAHTAQFFGSGGDDAGKQVDQVLDSIAKALVEAGRTLQDVVKLNVYVARAGAFRAVKAAITKRFPEDKRPAISLVEGAFMNTASLVAMDAVATTAQNPGAGVTTWKKAASLSGSEGANHIGILPTGTRVYISGRAARKGTIPEATQATMVQIKDTLAFLGLGLEHVVHIKSFMQPIAEMDQAEQQIIEFFDGDAPPMAFTEWSSTNPIEIEVIATSPDEPQSTSLEYLMPPDDKPSPVFSRVAKLYHPATIYVSGLWGPAGADSDKQIHEIFASLKQILSSAESDLNHLAKATYYPSQDDSSSMLNEIRPEYYDPKRPPAASKALVSGTGFGDRTITLDMIAVPSQ